MNWRRTYPQFDVHVWLSHAPGQKSYWDSNPSHVESFFKHRFERGLTGDVCSEISSERKNKKDVDVSYSDLKQYVRKRVASDASNHYLIQTPVFLEPNDKSDKFMLLRLSSKSIAAAPGKLFGYRKRDKLSELDTLWDRFQKVRHEYEWDMENPLAVQQVNMLLLQMERLWYEGKGNTELFAALEGRVNSVLDAHYTLKPVQHSLSDALADAQRMKVNLLELQNFPPDWLEKLKNYESLPEGEERSALEKESDARAKAIRKWQIKYPDWRGGYLVWQSLVAPDKPINRQMIQQGLDLLTPEQTVANKLAQSGQQVVFEEILFLQRLADELVWPDKESDAHKKFERLVRFALEARGKSNQFTAALPPVMTDQFAAKFEVLESERRQFEDRLFAHDGLFGTASNRLSMQYDRLAEKYERLLESSNIFAQRFAAAQSKLINSAHDFRYRLESLASAGNESSDTSWIKKYFDKIRDLSQTKIGTFSQSDPAAELSKLETADQAVFSGMSKKRAKSPEQDLVAFANANLNLGVADGNLLGRRLVFWPDLALQDRQRLHDELSTKLSKYVTLDEDEQNNLASDPEAAPSVLQDGLMEAVVKAVNQLPSMQPMIDQVDVPSSSEEQFLLRVAVNSSRLTPYQNFAATKQSLAELVNGFHARKSDLDFRRTAYDLCGTKTAGNHSFVHQSLKMHQQLIEDRLDELVNREATQELSSIRGRIATVWRATYDKGRHIELAQTSPTRG